MNVNHIKKKKQKKEQIHYTRIQTVWLLKNGKTECPTKCLELRKQIPFQIIGNCFCVVFYVLLNKDIRVKIPLF